MVASHHIGDLEHLATYRSFLQAVDHLCHLYGVHARGGGPRPPPRVPVDQARRSSSTCPRSASSTTTPTSRRAWSSTAGRRRCWASPSTAWATAPTARSGAARCWWPTSRGFERVGHLAAGADARRRGRHPRAVAHGRGVGGAAGGRSAVPARSPASTDATREAVLDLAERGLSPRTTSIGRLFDAVAALLGRPPARQLRGPGGHRAGGAGPHASPAAERARPTTAPSTVHGDRRAAGARPAAARRRGWSHDRERRRGPCRWSPPASTRRSAGPAAALAASAGRGARPRHGGPHRRRVPERCGSPRSWRPSCSAAGLARAGPPAGPAQRRRHQHRPGRHRRRRRRLEPAGLSRLVP